VAALRRLGENPVHWAPLGNSADARQERARLATFRRRILRAQTLYAAAALICLVSTLASVIALALVQLYFIVSPRLARGARKRPGAGQGL
jgi:hypothetical protein